MKQLRLKFIGTLFFFLNAIGLPAPILFTNLLACIKAKAFLKSKELKLFGLFAIGSLAYGLVHFWNGVSTIDYLKTAIFMQLMVFSSLVAYRYIKEHKAELDSLFQFIAYFGFGLFILALVLQYTSLKEWFWINHDFSIQGSVLRYKGLSYEPSFYALCLAPVFIYFFVKSIYISFTKSLFPLIATLIPLLATLSFGFFGVLSIAAVCMIVIVLIKYRQIHKVYIAVAVVLGIALSITLSFDNMISKRVDKMLEGNDTSFNGRVAESYFLANEMLQDKSVFFGIGLGQIKILGEKHIRNYYGYSKEEWPVMTIPNASAETLAIYGYVGLFLRLALQLFLFIKLKVYQNYFSLYLFLFLFIYQLMGSFITSTTELTLWALVFVLPFNELNIKKRESIK